MEGRSKPHDHDGREGEGHPLHGRVPDFLRRFLDSKLCRVNLSVEYRIRRAAFFCSVAVAGRSRLKRMFPRPHWSTGRRPSRSAARSAASPDKAKQPLRAACVTTTESCEFVDSGCGLPCNPQRFIGRLSSGLDIHTCISNVHDLAVLDVYLHWCSRPCHHDTSWEYSSSASLRPPWGWTTTLPIFCNSPC